MKNQFNLLLIFLHCAVHPTNCYSLQFCRTRNTASPHGLLNVVRDCPLYQKRISCTCCINSINRCCFLAQTHDPIVLLFICALNNFTYSSLANSLPRVEMTQSHPHSRRIAAFNCKSEPPRMMYSLLYLGNIDKFRWNSSSH